MVYNAAFSLRVYGGGKDYYKYYWGIHIPPKVPVVIDAQRLKTDSATWEMMVWSSVPSDLGRCRRVSVDTAFCNLVSARRLGSVWDEYCRPDLQARGSDDFCRGSTTG